MVKLVGFMENLLMSNRILLALIISLIISCNHKNDNKFPFNNKIIKNEYRFKASKNLLLGKFDYKIDSNFVLVSKSHSLRENIYLNTIVYDSFKKMHNIAKKENIELFIISGTRSFNQQKIIWESKWNKLDTLSGIERVKQILTYSSMPSTSRHHWGTDIDINSVEDFYFETIKGKKEYNWLVKNANKFGFYQTYRLSSKNSYNEEKWHWSFRPISKEYLKQYNELINYKEITDFKGSEYAKELNILKYYVNGISNECK